MKGTKPSSRAQQGGQAGGQHAAAAGADVEVVRHQQGHGREHRHDVAGQLGIRLGEEQDDEGDPDQQQQARRKRPGRFARLRAPSARLCTSTPDPGHAAGGQQDEEDVPGGFAVVLLLQEAVEVFVDEEEVRLLGFFRPTSTNQGVAIRKNSSRPLTRCRRFQMLPVAREQRVQHQHAARQHQADQALGQHRQRHAGPAGQHPVALLGGVASSRWAISRAHSATVIMPDRPMSSELTWLQATQ
jgi:hypothetical protein